MKTPTTKKRQGAGAEGESEVKKTKEVKLSDLLQVRGAKSQAIRVLAAEGLKTNEIAKRLGLSYQHVHNVLRMKAKKEAEKSAAIASGGLNVISLEETVSKIVNITRGSGPQMAA